MEERIINSLPFFYGFLISIFLSTVLILIALKSKLFGYDQNTGVQKIHSKKALRLGGSVIYISIFISIISLNQLNEKLLIGAICALPMFIICFLEDLSLNVKITSRLLGCILSSFLLLTFNEINVNSLNIVFLDKFLSIYFFSLLFTVVGITATANAWNFIDGLNGLSSGVGIICLISFYFLSDTGHLPYIRPLIINFIGILFGFFLLNIITGRLFLGDTGSYLIGFFVAWIGLEIYFNDKSISSWVIFLIILFPAIELIFSFFRRLLLKKSPFRADNKHLHTILYLLLRKNFKKFSEIYLNSFTGLVLIFFACFPSITYFIFGNKLENVYQIISIYIIIYLVLYFSLIKIACREKII